MESAREAQAVFTPYGHVGSESIVQSLHPSVLTVPSGFQEPVSQSLATACHAKASEVTMKPVKSARQDHVRAVTMMRHKADAVV